MTDSPRVLIVGIGSPFGDDQAGWLVIDALNQPQDGGRDGAVPLPRNPTLPHITARKLRVPLDLLDLLSDGGVAELHVCDACTHTSPPGTVHHVPCDAALLQSSQHRDVPGSQSPRSGHDFSVIDVLQLADSSATLPRRVDIWTMTGTRFAASDSIDPGVVAGARSCARQIRNMIDRSGRRMSEERSRATTGTDESRHA